MAGRRRPNGEDATTEEPEQLESEQFDGAELLDAVQSFLETFVAYPSPDAAIAHTLWIAHTHLMAAWESTPRIAFLSPEPGSGKTRALEITETLVPRPVEADQRNARVPVPQGLRPRRTADDLVRRDRHAVRTEGEGQRGNPRHPQRRAPARRHGRALRRQRQDRRDRGVARLLRRCARRAQQPARHDPLALRGHSRCDAVRRPSRSSPTGVVSMHLSVTRSATGSRSGPRRSPLSVAGTCPADAGRHRGPQRRRLGSTSRDR